MAGGLSSLGGFLQGFLPPIEKRITQQIDQENALKAEQRQIKLKSYFAAAATPGVSPETLESLQKEMKPLFPSKQAYETFLKANALTQKISQAQQGQQGQQQPSVGQNVMSGSPGSMKPTGTGQPAQPPQQQPSQGPGAQALPPPPQSATPAQQVQQLQDQRAQQAAQSKEQMEIQKARDMIAVDVDKAKAMIPVETEKQTALAKAQSELDSQEFKSKIDQAEQLLGHKFGSEELRQIAYSRVGIKPEEGASTEKIDVKGPDGKTQVGFRDPKSGKVFDASHNEIDMSKGYSVVEKETTTNSAEVKDLKRLNELQRQAATKPLSPEENDELLALTYRKKQLDDASRRADTRVNVTLANAANSNQPATPSVTSYWADFIAKGGHIDYGLLRNLGKKQMSDIMAEVPRIAASRGQRAGDLISGQADVKALASTLSTMEKTYAQTASFEKTARANLERAINAAKPLVDSGSPFVNRPWREVEKQLLGKPEYQAFNAARTVAFTEVSKVLNNPTSAGAVSDSARKEAESLIGENATLAGMQAAADILRADMTTRINSMGETIQTVKSQLKGQETSQTPGSRAVGKPETKEYQGHTYSRSNPSDPWKLVK